MKIYQQKIESKQKEIQCVTTNKYITITGK